MGRRKRMATLGAEAVRRNFLTGFIPGSGLPIFDPPQSDEAWDSIETDQGTYPRLSLAFWTSKQRQAANLHEISYRACYKPQLPRHFIERLTQPGDRVYDPFSGRGTTILEAALLGRRVAANDVNPLSRMLAEPRLQPPTLAAVAERLQKIPRRGRADGLDLAMFFHPDTEAEIRGLRDWCLDRAAAGTLDPLDTWIRMVATNRLTGHSPGFFSVYTLPPNQALTAEKQLQINAQRQQSPSHRDTHALILKKTKQLLSGLEPVQERHLAQASRDAVFFSGDARRTPELANASVALTVTSPPFLDVVDYAGDNWLRCWFAGLDAPRHRARHQHATHGGRLVRDHGGGLRGVVPRHPARRLRGLRGGRGAARQAEARRGGAAPGSGRGLPRPRRAGEHPDLHQDRPHLGRRQQRQRHQQQPRGAVRAELMGLGKMPPVSPIAESSSCKIRALNFT